MKWLALGVLGFMAVWSLAMAVTGRPKVEGGSQPLVWTSDDNPQRADQVDLFNKINAPLTVKLDPANQGMEKVIVQSMGGVGPDLFDCRDAAQLSSYVQAGIAWDVTQELEKMGIDLKRDAWQAMHPTCLWEDKVYGLPTNIAVNALWVHKDLLAKKGITAPQGPWKWDEFLTLAKSLTIKEGDRTVQYGFMFDWYNWPHFFRGYGADVFSSDGTKCIVDAPSAIKAVELMHDLVYLHKVSPSPVEEAGLASKGGWGSGTINLFGAKRAAMALGGRWWMVNLSQFEGLQLGVVESPHGTHRAFSALGRSTLINRSSPRRNEALKFLAYLASEPYADLIEKQQDGSPAFKAYSAEKDSSADDQSRVWAEATRFTVPDWSSPYVSGYVVNRIMSEQLDLVKGGTKAPADAMKRAAQLINAEIAKAISTDPNLKQKFNMARQGGAL